MRYAARGVEVVHILDAKHETVHPMTSAARIVQGEFELRQRQYHEIKLRVFRTVIVHAPQFFRRAGGAIGAMPIGRAIVKPISSAIREAKGPV